VIEKYTVVFPQMLFDGLLELLTSKEPNETGCFLLAHHYTTRQGYIVLTITDMVKPDESSWNYQGENGLEPTSAFINESVLKADTINASLIFVHTHPNAMHPLKFSPIDEETNGRLLVNLSEILEGKPVGSIVFSQHGASGIIFYRDNMTEITRIRVIGKTYFDLPTGNNTINEQSFSTAFDRQIRAIGMTSHDLIQQSVVSIVGVGGTGSAVAVQLARMGVKKLRLIDRDKVDQSNLSRLYGSTYKDVDKWKVNALKKHIRGFSRSELEILNVDITAKDVIPILVDSDIIFSCTDNLSSRAILNDIAVQYYIPLIDVGCRIDLDENGSINQAIAKVQVVTPTTACLWCTGGLDGKAILQESFSDEEKKKLANEGYYQRIDKQPSIISLTTLAATIAVNKFLSINHVFGDEYSSRTQLEVKGEFMLADSPEIKPNCICQKRKGLAEDRQIMSISKR
jgi:molybdopterin/thiamine biosynthesis adenylyltransferase